MKKYRIVKINNGLGDIFYRVDERLLFLGVTCGWDKYLLVETNKVKWMVFISFDAARAFGEELDCRWRNHKEVFVKRVNGISDYRIVKVTNGVDQPVFRADKAVGLLGLVLWWDKYIDKSDSAYPRKVLKNSLEDTEAYILREQKREENWNEQIIWKNHENNRTLV